MAEKKKKFRPFLLQLSKNITRSELDELKFLFDDHIPDSEAENIESAMTLMTILIKKGVISEDNLEELIDSLKEVGRGDLATRCEFYQKKALQAKCGSGESVPTVTPIQVQSQSSHTASKDYNQDGAAYPTQVQSTSSSGYATPPPTSDFSSGIIPRAVNGSEPYRNVHGQKQEHESSPHASDASSKSERMEKVSPRKKLSADFTPIDNKVIREDQAHSIFHPDKDLSTYDEDFDQYHTTHGHKNALKPKRPEVPLQTSPNQSSTKFSSQPIRSPESAQPKFIVPVAGKTTQIYTEKNNAVEGWLQSNPVDSIEFEEHNDGPEIIKRSNDVSARIPPGFDSNQVAHGRTNQTTSNIGQVRSELHEPQVKPTMPVSPVKPSTDGDLSLDPEEKLINDCENLQICKPVKLPRYTSLGSVSNPSISLHGPATLEKDCKQTTVNQLQMAASKSSSLSSAKAQALLNKHGNNTSNDEESIELPLGVEKSTSLQYEILKPNVVPDDKSSDASQAESSLNSSLFNHSSHIEVDGPMATVENPANSLNSRHSTYLAENDFDITQVKERANLGSDVRHRRELQNQLSQPRHETRDTTMPLNIPTQGESTLNPSLIVHSNDVQQSDGDIDRQSEASTFRMAMDLTSNPEDLPRGSSKAASTRDDNYTRSRPQQAASHSAMGTEMSEIERRRQDRLKYAESLLDEFSDDSDLADDNEEGSGQRENNGLNVGEKTLRNYQLELAQVGLQGTNCIICAPTGSGKTMTAGYICRERRRAAIREGRMYKTLFIVCIRNLIKQQAEALRELFPDNSNIVGDIGETELLKDHLKCHDVVVLTAQILVNCLRAGEVDISGIDLLIMDECHHTNLDHAYNNIMRHIHEKRFDPRDHSRLPQIIGLTASLGVGKDEDNTIDHYIKMCANLDCSSITHIRNEDNKRELLEHNPKPTQDQITAVPNRKDDTFIYIIRALMSQIERITRFFVSQIPPASGTQAYTQWVVKEKQEAEARDAPQARDTVDSCEALNALSVALEYYDDLTGAHVLQSLDEHFAEWNLPSRPSPHKERIYQQYQDKKEQLWNAVDAEDVRDQPKLQALEDLLVRLFEGKVESRVILLTRTIFSTIALVKFVTDNLTLVRAGVIADRIVGKGDKKGCMTDMQQEDVLKRFRDGTINLLIATDVAQEGLDIPRCNLLIRYNFVSNEIGQVQAKGRARAKQSECYLIINKGSKNERRELANLQREHKMMEALDEIDLENPASLRERIQRKKKQLFDDYQWKKNSKMDRGREVAPQNVTIVCKKCKTELGHGNDIVRKGESHYINTHPAFPTKVILKKGARREFRYDSHIGTLVCNKPECENALGIKILYSMGMRREGYSISCKGIMMRIVNSTNFDDRQYYSIKQWSKVPFHSNLVEEKLAE